MIRYRLLILTAAAPLLVYLPAAPYLSGNGPMELAADDSEHMSETWASGTPGATHRNETMRPCEGLIHWTLILTVVYLVHRLVFWFNPLLEAATSEKQRIFIGETVMLVLTRSVLVAFYFEANSNHVAAELSVGAAQAIVLGVVFTALRKNLDIRSRLLEIFGHELCSLGVLLWIVYFSSQSQDDQAPLVVGAAGLAHLSYAFYCVFHGKGQDAPSEEVEVDSSTSQDDTATTGIPNSAGPAHNNSDSFE